MNGIGGQCTKVNSEMKIYGGKDDSTGVIKKPAALRNVSWSENVEDSEIEVPGSPRTPRTSTTPGIVQRVAIEPGNREMTGTENFP